MHGEEKHEGSVHEIDEHVWTSPVNASVIVEKIKEVLIQKDSENKAAYEENADRYQTELAQLDKRFREVVRQSKRNLLIFGDRFPFLYFAKEYGLEYYAAFPGCAGDTEPSAATMVFLIEKAKDENVPAVLKMELSNADIANAVAEASGTEVRIFYSCHNLSIGYEGQTVVKELNFSIERGDYLCIVGENGSGKSTLVKSLLGLKGADRGKIIYGDGLKKNEIGYLPQKNEEQKGFPASVYEVVLSGRLNGRGWKPFYRKEDKEAAAEKMEMLGITDLARQCFRDLSCKGALCDEKPTFT